MTECTINLKLMLKIYGCGIGLSADLKLSKSKAVLDAKVAVADIVSSTIVKKKVKFLKKQIREQTSNIIQKKVMKY